MTYQNNSRKGSQTAKGKAAPKSKSTVKNISSKGKTTAKTSSSARVGNRTFQAQDIKSLVHNQGRANFGGQEWALKAPSWSDSTLQAIISDPRFTARPTSGSPIDGRCTYELSGHGKTIKVTIAC
ncbi:MAG: hypothetical protein FJX71_03085 [Alphaproteobacteria bacterium]|nr:hypothetical protein [Alphaproteobacteria bacterium]